MRVLLLTVAATAALTGAAAADPARDALKEASKCVEIAAAADRLKCFDAAMVQAQAALAAVPPTTPQVAEEESGGVMAWFGLDRPAAPRKPEDFGKPPAAIQRSAEITSLSASVLEFAKNAHGKSLFILDNGQVWKQIEGDTTDLQEPRKGQTMRVTIEIGLMGSYNLTVEGRTGLLRVRRVK